ncbi:MAG TPA: DegT/DnrJ/EryC1/StrS family aminotransferase [Acidimicrobiia bacterium]|jgi:dTDP-4-amino-4,6-dideoxygalactose transaminase
MTGSDLPAILGGTPMCDASAWPRWPQWDDSERTRLLATLDSGNWWSGSGDVAAGFARDFAAYHNAAYGIPVTNGSHALETALAACGVGDGDEVIVPACTFVATATAVLAVNATPVVVDVDAETMCIDVDAVRGALTERTKAVIAVHVAGATADIDALLALCGDAGVHLVEDCAHAHGSRWRSRGVGSFGSFGTFSFQETKLMTAGEGGVLLCNDPILVERAESYINCGRVPGGHWYHHETYGSNLRMTEWQGAVLTGQLRRYSEQLDTRDARAALLTRELDAVNGVAAQRRDERLDAQGYYYFVFHYHPDAFAGLTLRAFEAALAADGVPLGVSYPSLTTLALFQRDDMPPRVRAPRIAARLTPCPHAEHIAASTVWVEHRTLLAAEADVRAIVRAVERIQRHAVDVVLMFGANVAG